MWYGAKCMCIYGTRVRPLRDNTAMYRVHATQNEGWIQGLCIVGAGARSQLTQATSMRHRCPTPLLFAALSTTTTLPFCQDAYSSASKPGSRRSVRLVRCACRRRGRPRRWRLAVGPHRYVLAERTLQSLLYRYYNCHAVPACHLAGSAPVHPQRTPLQQPRPDTCWAMHTKMRRAGRTVPFTCCSRRPTLSCT